MIKDQGPGSIQGQIDTILSKRAQEDDSEEEKKGKKDEDDEVLMKDEGIQLSPMSERSIDPIQREDQI